MTRGDRDITRGDRDITRGRHDITCGGNDITRGRHDMRPDRLRAHWAALTGTGGAASVALALLVLGCVFVAMAGPRESLGLRTRALQSSLARASPLVRSVTAASNYTDFTAAFHGPVSAGTLASARDQLRGSLASTGLPLAAASADWSGMTTAYGIVGGAARSAVNGTTPPELEVIYRDALAANARLVAGRYPRAAPGRELPIAVSTATAERFGLRPGSRLTTPGTITLTVTGILRPVRPGSAFWNADPVAATPQPPVPRGNPFWAGAAFVSAAEVAALQQDLDMFNGQLEWDFPVATGGVNADQAGLLASELNRASLRSGLLRLRSGTVNVTVTAGLGELLTAFTSTDAALATLLSLLFVSLTVIGIVVLLLGARMLAEHRREEFGLMRARGATRPQLALVALAGGAMAVLPGALAGLAAAVAVTPGDADPLAWWLAGVTVAVALAGPPLIASGRPGSGGAAGADGGARTLDPAPDRPVAARRWIAQGSAVVLAVGGIIVLRQQGLPSGGGLNPYISAAPVLVAVPAAVVVVWLSPLALRGLLRLAAARPGVIAFVGFARAARASLAAALPAFALVLALTVVAFGFMVRAAVLRGEVAASWQATGADAVISLASMPDPITSAQQRAITAAAGGARTTAVMVTTAAPAGGPPIDVVAVSPASYAALVAGTPYPRFRPGLLAEPAGAAGSGAAGSRAPVPVLASPAVAAGLGRGTASLATALGTLRVRVAGRLSGTPAVPGGGFILFPAWAIGRLHAAAPPTALLIVGPRLNAAALAAAVARIIPQAGVTLRSSALAALTGAALPRGAYLAFAQGSVAAGGFCVLVLLLTLVLAARSRALTLARLSTMGLGAGQGRWLLIAEALPPVLAAAAAGAACALALVLGPVLDLSVFTGSAAAVPVRADLAALAIPAAGLIILGAATLSAQAFLAARRGAASALRISG
jgi:putative ABC transport system permease protein